MKLNKTLLTFGFLPFIISCGLERGFPAWQFFPDMYESPAREAQEFDPTAPNKVGGRLPPAGTVPVDFEPYEFDAVTNINDLPGKEKGLVRPSDIKESLATYKKGEDKFQVNCFPCHGPRGQGNGPVNGPAPKMNVFPIPNLAGEDIAALTDGQLYHVITKGWGRMPAYASQIEPDDRWKIIMYIRKIQEAYKSGKISDTK